MRRIARTLPLILAGLVLLSLGIDAIVGISQPTLEPGAGEDPRPKRASRSC